MPLDRRSFLLSTAGVLVGAGAQSQTPRPLRFSAVAFDAFPIFDPRPVAAMAESMFPTRGAALMDAWRTRQFEYQWLRALGGRYVDIMQATTQSLQFATKQLQLDAPEEKTRPLVDAFSNLGVWPDVPATIAALRQAGLRLVFLSNMTEPMLDAGLRRAGLRQQFEAILSTDAIKTYKPDPRAYQLGVDALELSREQVLFVAFAGWDVAGARWFGYPTFWANRSNARLEALDAEPDASGTDLSTLIEVVQTK